MTPPPARTSRDLHWRAGDTPASKQFGDIYFSPADGRDESRYVFLDGIGAPDIWRGRDPFRIGETGFGTGLNFLNTVRLWRETAAAGARLTYVSTEKYPLRGADIRRALARWPDLGQDVETLLKAYPDPCPGVHSLCLWDGRVRLLLLIGDATDMLRELEGGPVDAWYLDGFAPSRNPDMWSEALFKEIARLSAPGTRLATFTAAGFVRRGLEAAGFAMTKRPGFGNKRECLRGRMGGDTSFSSRLPPWYALPRAVSAGAHIAVLGAGLAGLLMAYRLCRDGFRVTLIDRRKSPMSEASGNPAAILDPVINRGHTPAGRFYQQALVQALRFYGALGRDIFRPCGLERRPVSAADRERLEKFYKTRFLPDSMLQQIENGALLFPGCGYLYPARLRAALLPGLDFRGGEEIAALQPSEDSWRLLDRAGGERLMADAVVLAAPGLLRDLPQSRDLPLEMVRGQISYFQATENAPERVIGAQSYLTPPVALLSDGAAQESRTHIAGAGFDRLSAPPERIMVTPEDHVRNRQAAAGLLPGLAASPLVGGRAGIRYFTPDRLPLAGPVPVAARYREDYAGLHHGPRHRPFPPAVCHPHLYVLSGLGARGFLTAPLLSAYLAALIEGEALPLPRSVIEALHPARFLVRGLKRQKRNF